MEYSMILPQDGASAVKALGNCVNTGDRVVMLIIGEEPENIFDLALRRARENPETRLVLWCKDPEPEMSKEIDRYSNRTVNVLGITFNMRGEVADVIVRGETHLPMRMAIAFTLAEKGT